MSRIRRLKLRLELLQYIMSVAPECLPPGLDEKLWTYLVGASALGQSERDVGFEFYITHFSNCRGCFDPILEHAFRRHFPVLDPAYFSSHVLNFCKMSIDYLNRSTEVQRQPEMMEEDSLNVDGIEQLWRIILDANNEILASDASTYLVNFYLDSRAVLSKPPGVVEATHFKMVERCIAQLNSAALDITGSEVTDGSPMALDSVKDNTFQNNERVFQRSLDLLDQFIKGYKNRSEYNKGFQEQSQGSGLEMITGLPLTIRLRWHGFNYQSPVFRSTF
ncbi:hypothetical protein L873DRAFT_1270836 [Choiromyces venosus 120613-1]|uniref:Uncharacterized protein n=1 Tax=Choiromyces venosus 120613-1 TaxID=1336337 RepID=A0A3N4JI15_9PEZI|nr:hypothetical protein L873DRAFT_1270836 [Choiromyces venosus 120613-1]